MLCRSRLEAAKGLRSVSAQMEAAQGRLQQAQQELEAKDAELRHIMADAQKSAAKRDHLK